jgi:hypothetical protein
MCAQGVVISEQRRLHRLLDRGRPGRGDMRGIYITSDHADQDCIGRPNLASSKVRAKISF